MKLNAPLKAPDVGLGEAGRAYADSHGYDRLSQMVLAADSVIFDFEYGNGKIVQIVMGTHEFEHMMLSFSSITPEALRDHLTKRWNRAPVIQVGESRDTHG